MKHISWLNVQVFVLTIIPLHLRSQQLRGLLCCAVQLLKVNDHKQLRLVNHSHSIVAGGLCVRS